jgi:5'-nucleotidase
VVRTDRGVAQTGSALAWGASGRGFKSRRPDSEPTGHTTGFRARETTPSPNPGPARWFAEGWVRCYLRCVAILLSNDDGISSAGLKILRETLATLDEVWVVAPDRDQSAVSHSLTLYRPLRIENVGARQYAVDGTPTDCINLAINGILTARPRLIISGINHGANLGDDITYSGTVSAAMEGTLLGVPSIAVSLVARENFDFEPAAMFTREVAAAVLRQGLPADTLININVPALPAAEIKGYALTRQGKRRYGDAIVEKIDPRGKKYYWIGGGDLGYVDGEGTDFNAIERGLISLTPLHLDLTNYRSLRALEQLKLRWPAAVGTEKSATDS